jgi:hypothetical protein
MTGVMAHAGQLGDHHRDPLQGPQVGVEPVGHRPRQQRLLDLGELGGRQLGIRAGRTPAAQGVHAALSEAGVPDMGALARDAELVGDLGLGAALGEQLGRLQPSGLKGGTLLGRAWAAVGWHRRTLTHHQSSRQPNPRNSIKDLGCRLDRWSPSWSRAARQVRIGYANRPSSPCGTTGT